LIFLKCTVLFLRAYFNLLAFITRVYARFVAQVFGWFLNHAIL